jgi:DNA-binding NarL/FixJ family response regulator
MIRIGLVEDQQLVREGIARLLSLNANHQLIWQAENGERALAQISSQAVDLIISDIRMPVMDGITLVETLRENSNATPVLILTTFDDHQLFLSALRAGINGFLLKDISLEKLNSAINTVVAGGFLAEPVLLASDAAKRASIEPNDHELPASSALSQKDCQILRYIAAGFSNKEIATAVCLAEGTVKNRISDILLTLDCRDRTQAVLKALRWQLI